MPQSETIAELAKAMSQAQSQALTAHKDKANPFFKSKYADLASTWDACREALSTNGLAVIQTTSIGELGFLLTTTLVHTSGEWISGDYPIDPTKKDPQGYGSAVTYARRYALQAIVGIAPADDDGNAASGRADARNAAREMGPPRTPPPTQSAKAKAAAQALNDGLRDSNLEALGATTKPTPGKPTPKQFGAIYVRLGDFNMEKGEAGRFLRWHFEVPSATECSRDQVSKFIDSMGDNVWLQTEIETFRSASGVGA